MLHEYVTELGNVALVAETVPFAGFVRPVHIAPVMQVVPLQPAAHAHVKLVPPVSVQVRRSGRD